MKNKCMWSVIALLLFVVAPSVQAQVVARIDVRSGASKRVNTMVSTSLRTTRSPMYDSLRLVEVRNDQRIPVPFQLYGNTLHWILDGTTERDTTRIYELIKGAPLMASSYMQVKDTAGTLLLREGARKLLQYNYQTVEPPAGIDKMYRRSGFIHPLWAPDGQVITNIHPKGHWHHMGIWNPWTHTSFKGNETDFWNLQKKEGTVRFKGIVSRMQGPVVAGFVVLHDHIAFTGGTETVAISEEWAVRAYRAGTDTTRFIWDFYDYLNCADTAGITFLQYRYGGGFGLRTNAAWTANNSEVLTSEGKTRANADSTRARWIKITGRTEKGKAGILVMNFPGNYDSPQPVRVWPENSERGEIMMNYSPTKMKPWTLQYGKAYALYYRVVSFMNDLTTEEIEHMWQDYIEPPEVTVYWN
ncbi:DUF6807 domain-containing protein [Chitinophaga agri]|uniref:DUF4861 domain-containing protein n=1 Tax=Chitinophaga agri TaxID=2703787 RepID=A0A6B9ZDL7_9BACT|nr:PmoA family protein [Chitinophaga agri]QHS60227.1 hypothetical protein GWR21_11640 [Chitinophaga agri]